MPSGCGGASCLVLPHHHTRLGFSHFRSWLDPGIRLQGEVVEGCTDRHMSDAEQIWSSPALAVSSGHLHLAGAAAARAAATLNRCEQRLVQPTPPLLGPSASRAHALNRWRPAPFPPNVRTNSKCFGKRDLSLGMNIFTSATYYFDANLNRGVSKIAIRLPKWGAFIRGEWMFRYRTTTNSLSYRPSCCRAHRSEPLAARRSKAASAVLATLDRHIVAFSAMMGTVKAEAGQYKTSRVHPEQHRLAAAPTATVQSAE